MKLEDYCLVKDDFLSEKLCKKIIETYNENSNFHQRFDYDRRPNFTQLNFTQNKEIDENLHDICVKNLIDACKLYQKTFPETLFWKPGFDYEQFRIKHYKKELNDEFDWHVDSSNLDTCKRFLAIFWYLNDVEDGGETTFINNNLSVKPKTGRLIMFPPFWMYPHKGNIPKSNDKYLLSTYLHAPL